MSGVATGGKAAAPSLSIGSDALTVNAGGSVALPISVSPTSGAHAASVTITGLASYETITDALDHQVFSGNSITLTAAEVNSGLSLASAYTGTGHPVNTLTVTASETVAGHTVTSATQSIVVTDPPVSTVSANGATLTPGSSGSLVTSAGTWTFGTATAGGGHVVLLNGAPATNGAATSLVVEQGNLYAENAQGNWYEWVNANWTQVAEPATPPANLSANGATLAPGSSGSLVTSDGTWTFSTATAAGGNLILLNGAAAGSGAAASLIVEQGHLYAENAQGNWYEWVNGGWSQTTDPAALSAQGSSLAAGSSGSLVTSNGIWSFSSATAGGGNVILLNGAPAGNGSATSLTVEQGNLYAENAQGNWYEWVNGNWAQTTDPVSSTPTLSGNGASLAPGASGDLVTSDGTWTFSTATAGGGNVILLNGSPAGNGAATSLVVEQGHLYAENAQGNWYEWSSGNWTQTTDPVPGQTAGDPPSGGSGSSASGSTGSGDTTGTSSSTGTGTSSSTGAGDPPSTGTGAGSVPSGAGYYVSPNGSDSNPGTEAAPFATLARAQQAMEDSSIKTTYVEAGTYDLSSTLTLTSADSGETWTYLPADGVNTAVLNGNDNINLISISGASNVTIDGLKLENFSAYGIEAANTPYLTVENCDVGYNVVTSWSSAGICVGGTSPDVTIANNYVHNVGSQGIALFDGYSTPGNISGSVIEGNVVLDAVQRMSDGGAIYVSEHGGSNSTVTVKNNYVADYGAAGVSGAVGIYLDDNASDVTVTGNVVGPPTEGSVGTGNFGAAGIELHNGHNNTITDNIIDLGDSGRDFAVTFGQDSNSIYGMNGNSFIGNIVVSSYTGTEDTNVSGITGANTYVETPGTSATTAVIEDNVYYNYAGGQISTAGNVTGDSNPIIENPELSGPTYTIAAASPVYNSPVNFTPIVGGWGPPGFVIPTTGIVASDTV